MLVGYRLGALSYMLARRAYRPTHVTLVNIAGGDREIIPEFIQDDLRGDRLARAALDLLASPERRASQVAQQTEALAAMGYGEQPAPERAAEAILAGLTRS